MNISLPPCFSSVWDALVNVALAAGLQVELQVKQAA